ncbi:ABC transporter ATP-binding protein [Sediminispirochaeta bajacaliforniensis]|uniref:ABC transporter ATP-binding protein n=1 Tax=Sediminispirochaeta bajacaliforniensis TaxID=148 RepID=UPI0003816BCF|nr:ABC transporter ATP-binding protein [Sediminispirochaeta bajacaliforniensis]
MKLIIEQLVKQFDDFSFEASFQADIGSFITLLGPSGGGKTTALQLISGLIPPDSGHIYFGDIELSRLEPWKRDIGFVFQDYALFPHMSVEENVAYGLQQRQGARQKKEEITDRVTQMLTLVGLEGFEKRKPETLSGGERQRVALARAIAPDPRLLLFDEPLSALDAPLRSRLREEIRELQKKLGITTIYVTHDRDEALSMSDLIVIMNEGRVIEQGAPRTLYRRPATLFTARFLGEGSTITWEGKNDFFRPENATLLLEPEDSALRGKMKSLRYLGGRALATIILADETEISAMVPEREIDAFEENKGKPVWVRIDKETLISVS